MDVKKMTTEEIRRRVKESLLKQKAHLGKYGVDLSKQWKELQASQK